MSKIKTHFAHTDEVISQTHGTKLWVTGAKCKTKFPKIYTFSMYYVDCKKCLKKISEENKQLALNHRKR